MNSDERRDHDREALVKAELPGSFSIEVEGETHGFNQVSDVSISGMGLVTDTKLSAGQELTIKYTSNEFAITIHAVVAWCTAASQDQYAVGLQYSTKDLDANVMLFMTLREYIDDFGEAF